MVDQPHFYTRQVFKSFHTCHAKIGGFQFETKSFTTDRQLICCYYKSLTWHVVHDHIKIFGILKCEMQLNDPFRIGVGHDVSLFPEKRAVTPFDLKDYLIDNF